MKLLYKSINVSTVLLLSMSGYAQPPTYSVNNRAPMVYPQQYVQPYGYPAQNYPRYSVPSAQANQPWATKQAATRKKPFREFSGYLGLATDILPASVAAQLPKEHSQGILFKKFSKNSPIQNSDLKPYDVIVAFNKKTIVHPAQFIKAVREAEPGSKANLKVIRQGAVIDIPITIGSQETPNPDKFNGLAIKQIGEDKYRAIIRFVGGNGNKQVRSYEGDREEIFQQALNAQDLPKAEREQLLYATRPRKSQSNNGFGSFFPFGNNNNGNNNNWMNPSKYFKPKIPW